MLLLEKPWFKSGLYDLAKHWLSDRDLGTYTQVAIEDLDTFIDATNRLERHGGYLPGGRHRSRCSAMTAGRGANATCLADANAETDPLNLTMDASHGGTSSGHASRSQSPILSIEFPEPPGGEPPGGEPGLPTAAVACAAHWLLHADPQQGHRNSADFLVSAQHQRMLRTPELNRFDEPRSNDGGPAGWPYARIAALAFLIGTKGTAW
jgi:hypothetical protein